MKQVQMLGARIDYIDVATLHAFLERTITDDDRALVLNVNVNCLNLAWDRPWLREFLNSAPVVFCDGAGVQLGARMLGRPPMPRIPYNTWMWEFAPFAASHGYGLFLLGAKPGVAARAAERLVEKNPTLRIVGVRDGYFDKSPGSAQNSAVIDEINASGAHVLLLSFGMPLQEQWLSQNWDRLRANVALTGGAALDYLSGELPMPPEWMAAHGLEWLQRLTVEPRRLWRRYLLGNPLFLLRVARQRLGGAPPERESTPRRRAGDDAG